MRERVDALVDVAKELDGRVRLSGAGASDTDLRSVLYGFTRWLAGILSVAGWTSAGASLCSVTGVVTMVGTLL